MPTFALVLFVLLLTVPYLGAFQSLLPSFVAQKHPAGDAPFHLQIGDLNADGHLDIAVANRDSDSVSIFLLGRDEQGEVHVNRWAYRTGKTPLALFVSDLDGDGDSDLATADRGDNGISLLLNQGVLEEFNVPDLKKSTSLPLGEAPHALWGGDLDGDGDVDLAVAKEQYGEEGNVSTVGILRNVGNAEFQLHASYSVETEPRMILGNDFDQDGTIDLITSNKGAGSISILFNDGTGNFPAVIHLEAGGSPQGLWVGDLGGDGDADVVVTNVSTDSITVLENQGKRVFTQLGPIPVQAQFPYAVVGGDIDRDGDVDLITANMVADGISVLLNQGHGQFEFAGTHPVGNGPRSIAVADFSGHGLLDVVVGNRFGDTITLLLQEP